jgi:hypothetical protein
MRKLGVGVVYRGAELPSFFGSASISSFDGLPSAAVLVA